MKRKYLTTCSLLIGGVIFTLLFCYRYEVKSAVKPYYKACKYEAKYRYMTIVNGEFPDTIEDNPWQGKRLLVIGDSQSALEEWQYYLSKYLDCEVKTHAIGGAGMLAMVDGMYSDVPDTAHIDPNKFGVDVLLPLNKADLQDIDLVIVMGLYNEVMPFLENYGSRSDMYPQQDTYCGKFNYMINRIRQEARKAGNKDCPIIVTNMHRCGSNPFLDISAYVYGDAFTDSLLHITQQNNVRMLDLMRTCVIDSTNWTSYHLCSTLDSETAAKYPQADATRPDYLHLNSYGHLAVAHALARLLNK